MSFDSDPNLLPSPASQKTKVLLAGFCDNDKAGLLDGGERHVCALASSSLGGLELQ